MVINHAATIFLDRAEYSQNRMRVTNCTVDNQSLTPEQAQLELDMREGGIAGIVASAVGQMRVLCGLCNSASGDSTTGKLLGDATDQAIWRFSEYLGGPVQYLREGWETVYELAFNSTNKYMIKAFSLSRHEFVYEALSVQEAEGFRDGDV
jgi:sodium/potassium-transporting ATPase subunit alpha